VAKPPQYGEFYMPITYDCRQTSGPVNLYGAKILQTIGIIIIIQEHVCRQSRCSYAQVIA